MQKQMKYTTVSIAMGGILTLMGSGVATAGAVNGANMTTFTSGTAAVASEVNGNFTELTTQVDDNNGRIAVLEAGPAGATSVDCSTGGSVQTAVNAAPPGGEYTINISGTCNENVVIERDRIKLLGSGGARIVGAITSPSVLVRASRARLIGVAVEGGSVAMSVTASGDAVIKNATLGSASTVDIGLLVSKNATATLIGNQDAVAGAVSSGGVTINGGNDTVDGTGVVATAGGTVHFRDGTTVVNAGGSGVAIAAGLGAKVLQSDLSFLSALTVSGSLEILENSSVLIGNGTVNGTAFLESNAVLSLDTDPGGTVNLTGSIDATGNSSIAVFGGATTGNIVLNGSSTLDVLDSGTSVGTIGASGLSFAQVDTASGATSGTCTADATSVCQ